MRRSRIASRLRILKFHPVQHLLLQIGIQIFSSPCVPRIGQTELTPSQQRLKSWNTIRLEFDQKVNIVVGSEITSQGRTVKSEPSDAVLLTEGGKGCI